MSDEVRIRNQKTGGEKGQKLARFDLVPVRPLTALAEHYGRGAAKYADRNWEKGTDWSLNYAALMRHVTQWWNGEDLDADTGSHHLTAVAWHAFALLEFAETHPELDDRPDRKSLPTIEEAWQAMGNPFEQKEVQDDNQPNPSNNLPAPGDLADVRPYSHEHNRAFPCSACRWDRTPSE